MVDLSKLKAGDTVHFRCGGKAVVEEVTSQKDKDGQTYVLRIESSPYTLDYWGCGSYFSDPHPFDIIRVESAFRWEDVRPGMAFVMTNKKLSEEVWFYLCPTTQPKIFLATTDRALGAYGAIEGTFSSWGIHDVIPAPEHDIEVAK